MGGGDLNCNYVMELKNRQERLVFVDPEDEDISYWWPAIVTKY